ncbi:MAG: 4'-phosphopantetheinyl transferase superfamily protein [Nonlabens sp.]
MPLYKTLNNRSATKVYIWEIEESEAWLRTGIKLSKNSMERLLTMSSELHRRGFLSIRHLLCAAGYSDLDLYYSSEGKPFLRDGRHISITHSFTFTGIIISDSPVGIDIEMQRDKIQRIAIKFIGFENAYLEKMEEKVRALTVIWGAKESMYKLYGTRGLGFKENCSVNNFSLNEGYLICHLDYNSDHQKFDGYFCEMKGFTLVYILPFYG